MKKTILFALGLFLGANAGAQTPPPNPSAPTVTRIRESARNADSRSDEGRKLQENLREASRAFMAAQDSKEAENKFVEAQKAVFEYQKKLNETREKALGGQSEAQKKSLARLREAEKKLEEAKKAFYEKTTSQQAREAFVKAQKEVFAARKEAQPLYLVDGKETPDLEGFDRKTIKSISVLKNPKDIAPYGDKGKNGVVMITTVGKDQASEPLEQIRMRYLSRAIGLKSDQREAFEKAYGNYTGQIELLRQENKTLSEKTSWQEALDKILKNNIVIEQKRYETYKNLKSVLSEEQLSRLYRADLRFARDMITKGIAPGENASRPASAKPSDKRPQPGTPGARPEKREPAGRK